MKFLNTVFNSLLYFGNKPNVVAATVFNEYAHNTMMIDFDKFINADYEPDPSDFTLNLSGGAVVVVGYLSWVSGIRSRVMLLLNRGVVYGETGTVTYTPGDIVLTGENGFKVGAFTIDITNNIASPALYLNDKDGNNYNTVIIGGQEWIVENLRTTTYADDSPITNLTVNNDWITDTGGAYCWYDNDIDNKDPYGALYNWAAVDHASGLAYFERNGVQETGWRVPVTADFTTLLSYLGGVSVAGGKLKEDGTTHWVTPNTGATNESGFTAVGAGIRSNDVGIFQHQNVIATFWSASATNPLAAHRMTLQNTSIEAQSGGALKPYGFSVRCVRDI